MSVQPVLSIVALSYDERAAIRAKDSFALQRDDGERGTQVGALELPILNWTLPAHSPLGALLDERVHITLHQGCANLRIANLPEHAREPVCTSLLDPASEESAWFCAVIKATVRKYNAENCIDVGCLRFMTAAPACTGLESELSALECEFVPYATTNNSICRDALYIVRDTLATPKLLVWSGKAGAEFSFRKVDGERFNNAEVRRKYRQWLKQSDAFVAVTNAETTDVFRFSDAHPAGLFVFSDQAGVAARGAEVVRQFLAQFERSWDNSVLEPLRSPSDVLRVDAPPNAHAAAVLADARLLDCTDVTFDGEHDSLFVRLLDLCQRCNSLQMIALTCTDNLSTNMLARVLKCAAENSVKMVFVDESLYLKTSPSIGEYDLLVPASADEIVFDDAWTKHRMDDRIDQAHAFVMRQFLFPDTDEDIAAERDRVRKVVDDAEAFVRTLGENKLFSADERLPKKVLLPFEEDKDVVARAHLHGQSSAVLEQQSQR